MTIEVLQTKSTDSQNAAEIKKRMTDKLKDVCAEMDTARHLGLIVNFNLGTDVSGQNVITSLSIARYF